MRWQVCSELVILHAQCDRRACTHAMACCLRDHSYTRWSWVSMASSGVSPVAVMTSLLSMPLASTIDCTEIPQCRCGVSSPLASCIISSRYQAVRSGYSSVRAASPRQSSVSSTSSRQAWQASIASSRQSWPGSGSWNVSSAGGIRREPTKKPRHGWFTDPGSNADR
jgi:hypothetical protein